MNELALTLKDNVLDYSMWFMDKVISQGSTKMIDLEGSKKVQVLNLPTTGAGLQSKHVKVTIYVEDM